MKSPIQALENCHSTRITSLTYRVLSPIAYGILSSIAYRNIVKKDDHIQEFALARIPEDLPSEIKANILKGYFWYSFGWTLGSLRLLSTMINIIVGLKIADYW